MSVNILVDANSYSYKSWSEYGEIKLHELKISTKWKNEIFNELFEEPDFEDIQKSILLDSKNNLMFPFPDLLFSAFNYTNYDKVKVVILGQDPYHGTELNNKEISVPQAMGLSFSVPFNMPVPSSLKNIYLNLKNNNHITKIPTHGNLQSWAYQGCLMMNTSLTVNYHQPNCHSKIWTNFTDKIIQKLSSDKENLVFVLWGSPALQKLKLIDKNKHKIIISSHPSGLSCRTKLKEYPAFNDCDHFGEINKYLKKIGSDQIMWNTL
jgi:uracil-DNA glycosylase